MRFTNIGKGEGHHLSTYGLAAFFFLTPFEYPLADLVSISPVRIVGLMAMGLAVFDIFNQRYIRFHYRFSGIFLWLAYGLLSAVWAMDMDYYQSYYSIYLNNSMMFLLFSLINYSEREADYLKKAMIAGICALILYMLIIPNAVSYTSYQNRLTLNAGRKGLDQNYLAALTLMPFGLVFYRLCNDPQKKKHRIRSAILCVVILGIVILSGSRSGLIALLLTAILSVNTSWKNRLKIGIPLLLLLIIVFPIAAQYLPQDLMKRFTLSAFTGQEAESGTRLVIWIRALSALRDFRWVFGYGVGASQAIVGDILGKGTNMAIHNHYIAMLAEVGLVGSVLINYPIFKMTVVAWKKDRPVAVAFAGILALAFFLDVVTTKFFWSAMILLSVCCSSRYGENKRRD